MTILRWIGFLPSALLATYITVVLMDRLFLSIIVIYPIPILYDFQLGNFYIGKNLMAFFLAAPQGAAFVYVGVKVAPLHKKYSAYGLAASGSLIIMFFIYKLIIIGRYFEIWPHVSVIIGLAVTTYYVVIDDIKKTNVKQC